MTLEREFQLLATEPLDVVAILAAAGRAGLQVDDGREDAIEDVYLDTAGRDLQRAGIGLRVRRVAGRGEVCAKWRGERRGALRERAELTAPWPATEPPAAVRELPAELYRAIVDVRPTAAGAAFATLVGLRTARTTFSLRHHDGGAAIQAELAFDRVTVVAGGRVVGSFATVELELQAAADEERWREVAATLCTDCGLQLAALDKLELALVYATTAPQG